MSERLCGCGRQYFGERAPADTPRGQLSSRAKSKESTQNRIERVGSVQRGFCQAACMNRKTFSESFSKRVRNCLFESYTSFLNLLGNLLVFASKTGHEPPDSVPGHHSRQQGVVEYHRWLLEVSSYETVDGELQFRSFAAVSDRRHLRETCQLGSVAVRHHFLPERTRAAAAGRRLNKTLNRPRRSAQILLR